VHALDHTSRLAEATQESAKIDVTLDGPDEQRAVKLYGEAMRTVAAAAGPMARASAPPSDAPAGSGPDDASRVEAVAHLGRCAQELAVQRLEHRRTTLESVASGKLTASDAIARVEAIRLLDQRAHHAWRAAAHLAAAVP
jgi:phosphate:Na+ symporter